jgi:hypothetical protein
MPLTMLCQMQIISQAGKDVEGTVFDILKILLRNWLHRLRELINCDNPIYGPTYEGTDRQTVMKHSQSRTLAVTVPKYHAL